jgi:SAM-dependent methyltransferase
MALNLNIGAGMEAPRIPNEINSDLYPGENIDVVFDACRPWPFKDNSIAFIRSNHVLEHLPDPWAFFREAWRVLIPSKKHNMLAYLPYGASDAALSDLSHVRPWTPGSFCCFQPGYNKAVRNPQFSQWGQETPFSVVSIYLRVNANLRWLLKPIIRRWGINALDYIWNGFIEMTVGMRAIKDHDDEVRWLVRYQPNGVPVVRYIYQHEYEGRELKEGELRKIRFVGEGAEDVQAQVTRDPNDIS